MPSDGIRRGAFDRCLGHEGGALVNGISGFIKEALESNLAPSVMQGSELSLDAECADALILDFLASTTVGNECLLFISQPG